ncbi:MAG: NAD(P)/FAD-dependent oxidoreductase [Geminicoccaceae bacterium]|nr:NAD(P)/FAD-dependent oxidoreductase [Geminicoccaceae bacterium]
MHNTQRGSRDRFDVAVIGSGVVGCAIARRLTLEGARVVILERADDILDGASKGNSAILHTGFDAPADSLELRCIRDGHAEYLDIHERLGLPLIRCGALVLAWNREEEARLDDLMEHARGNGIDNVEPLSRDSILRLEPHLSAQVRSGFRIPDESLMDPWTAPYAYVLQAIEMGAVLLRGCEVRSGEFDGDFWTLTTDNGPVVARFVVNAAGLFGDIVERRLTGTSEFVIRPRKGQFVIFDKSAASLATHILLPVPTEITKGVVVCRTAFGNLLVGPTAEEQDDRENAEVTGNALQALCKRGAEILPDLPSHGITTVYAGLRPASEIKAYRIKAHADRQYVTVGGIRSTGLSAALGIARHVHDLCMQMGLDTTPSSDIRWPRPRSICEPAPRDWQQSGHGGIVCHCEMVTRREIEDALSGPLAARSLAGLKRRTRVTMGRCQGFYCSAGLAALTRDRFARPIAVPIGAPEPPA